MLSRGLQDRAGVVYPQEDLDSPVLDKLYDSLCHKDRVFLDGLRCGTSVAQMAKLMGVSRQYGYTWRSRLIMKGRRLART